MIYIDRSTSSWTGPNLLFLVAIFWSAYLIMIGVYLIAIRLGLINKAGH